MSPKTRTYLTITFGISFSGVMVFYLVYFHREDVISPLNLYRTFFTGAFVFSLFNSIDYSVGICGKEHSLAFKANTFCLVAFYGMGSFYYFGIIQNDLLIGIILGLLLLIRYLLFLRAYMKMVKTIAR